VAEITIEIHTPRQATEQQLIDAIYDTLAFLWLDLWDVNLVVGNVTERRKVDRLIKDRELSTFFDPYWGDY
jgi:hypothetical protein